VRGGWCRRPDERCPGWLYVVVIVDVATAVGRICDADDDSFGFRAVGIGQWFQQHEQSQQREQYRHFRQPRQHQQSE
jgi:hypothetical protein